MANFMSLQSNYRNVSMRMCTYNSRVEIEDAVLAVAHLCQHPSAEAVIHFQTVASIQTCAKREFTRLGKQKIYRLCGHVQ